MAAMMQRRLGAKLRTADDYATADEKEIKELSAMTGIKYKQPARRPQPKRIAAPASTLVNLNELKQLAEEDGSPVKARKALAPPETAELGDVWWNTHREETEEPAPVARSPPRPASAASSTASVRRKQKAASAAFVASASTAAVASNRQATAGRKKTAPRRKTPDARRAPRGGILDDGAGPAVPRRKTPDAAVPRPGDPYKAAATAPTEGPRHRCRERLGSFCRTNSDHRRKSAATSAWRRRCQSDRSRHGERRTRSRA